MVLSKGLEGLKIGHYSMLRRLQFSLLSTFFAISPHFPNISRCMLCQHGAFSGFRAIVASFVCGAFRKPLKRAFQRCTGERGGGGWHKASVSDGERGGVRTRISSKIGRYRSGFRHPPYPHCRVRLLRGGGEFEVTPPHFGVGSSNSHVSEKVGTMEELYEGNKKMG